MLNGVANTDHRTTTVQQPVVIVLVAIALVAVVGGFIIISNYVMAKYTSSLSEQVRCSTLL